MKIALQATLLILVLLTGNYAIAQKNISEGTISYKIFITNTTKGKAVVDSASSTVYLKGSLIRSDFNNALGSETAIYDSKTGTATILKQYSGQKLMITLTKENWLKKNSKFDGIIFQTVDETKQVAGYTCKKAIAQLKDSTSFVVYYSPDTKVVNKDYNLLFKNLPGLPVQYEFDKGNLVFQYTLSSIDFNPLPSSKFDIPKSGYRVITYDDEQLKIKH